MTSASTKQTVLTGAIRADEIYPLPRFQELAGMSKAAVRTARRNGLKVKRIGRRSYVAGKDFLDYFENSAKEI